MTSTKIERFILKVGSKGEMFPPKEIRESLRLEPNQPILLTVHNDQLIIKRIYSCEEILKTPPKVRMNFHASKQFQSELQEKFER